MIFSVEHAVLFVPPFIQLAVACAIYKCNFQEYSWAVVLKLPWAVAPF